MSKLSPQARPSDASIISIFLNSPGYFAILTGPEFTYAYSNETHNLIIGRTVVGMGVSEVIPEFEGSELSRLLSRVYNGGETVTLNEFGLIINDGMKYFSGTYSPRRDDTGTIDGIFAWGVEVTDRVIVRQQLEGLQFITNALARVISTEDVSRVLLDYTCEHLGASNGIVITPPGKTGYLNVSATKNYPQELVEAWQHCPPERKLPVPVTLATGVGQYLESQEEMVRKFPELSPIIAASGISAFISVPLVSNGRIYGAVGFSFLKARAFPASIRNHLTSIANQCALAFERAAAYDRESLRNEELEKALRARDEFFSLASHELKTPLMALTLQTQLRERLLEKDDPKFFEPARMIEYVRITRAQTLRLSRLIDDILDVSRIRSGKLTLKKESVDLGKVLSENVKGLSMWFINEGYELPQLEISGDLTGLFDRARIDQVISNLLTNAVRYGEKKPISIRLREVAAGIELSVEDRGIGISEEDLPKIFQRFHQTVNRSKHGLGLGLFILEEIVAGHGGKVSVKSKIGVGTEFKVYLPKS